MSRATRLIPTPSMRLAVLVLLGLSVGAIPAVATANDPHPIEIGAAREQPLATVVKVEGSVPVRSGASSTSSFDEGFAIQDHSGGIYVSVATNLGLTVRQRVLVTGQLVDSFGLLTLVPASDSDVEVRGHGRRVEPLWVHTGSVGAANQGRLIRVVGVITHPVVPAPPFGDKVFVDDGSGPIRIFVNTSTGIDVSGLAPGQLLSVIGFSSEFNDPEIDPRFQSDLRQPDSR